MDHWMCLACPPRAPLLSPLCTAKVIENGRRQVCHYGADYPGMLEGYHRRELANSNVHVCMLAPLSFHWNMRIKCMPVAVCVFDPWPCAERYLKYVARCVYAAFFCLLALPLFGWAFAQSRLLVFSLSACLSSSVGAEIETTWWECIFFFHSPA